VVRSLVSVDAPRITYVSCDPATLARDLVPLQTAGYRVVEVHLVDLFPQTTTSRAYCTWSAPNSRRLGP